MLWSKSSGFFEKISFTILAAFMIFPLIDYILRNIIPIPVISSLWDEMLLFGGLVMVGGKLLLGNPMRSSKITGGIFALLIAGLAYTVLNMTTFSVNLEGYRAIFQYMFVFFIAFYLNDKPENTKALLTIAAVTGTLMAIHGIYQWLAGVPMPGDWVDTTETTVRTRSFSIVGSPNALGSQMAMMATIALGLLLEEKNKLKKFLWFGAFALLVICLVFTGSRGAWLAFAGAIALIGVIFDRRILFAGIIAVAVALVFVPAVRDRIFYLFSAEYMMKSQQSGRISRWFEAYDQMRNNPIFGAGLGHFGGAVAKREFNTIYVDNYYMKTLAEMGLLGLSLFVWLIGRTLLSSYHAMKNVIASPYKFLAVGMFGGLLTIVLHNGVENIFEIPYLNTYFWLVAGLLAALPFNARVAGGGSKNEQKNP